MGAMIRHHHHHHQNASITNECNTGFALINQFDPALNPIRMFVMIALSALVGEAIRFRTNIIFEKIAPIGSVMHFFFVNQDKNTPP